MMTETGTDWCVVGVAALGRSTLQQIVSAMKAIVNGLMISSELQQRIMQSSKFLVDM